jgi:hypothetical protein
MYLLFIVCHWDSDIFSAGKSKMKKNLFTVFTLLILFSCERFAEDDISSTVTFQLSNIQKIISTRDGGFLIAGESDCKTTFIKTDANFGTIWRNDNYSWGSNIYGSWGQSSYSYRVINIFPDENDNYLCFGSVTQGGCVMYSSSLIVELSPEGKDIKRKEIKNFVLYDVINTQDGGYLLSGSNLLKLGSNFESLWEINYRAGNTAINKVINIGDGNFAVTCRYNDGSYLRLLDNNGNELWSRKFEFNNDIPLEEIGFGLIRLKDNGFLIAGRTRNHHPLFDMDCGITRLNASGDMIWSAKFGSGSEEWLENIFDLSDNEFVIQGNVGYPNDKIQKSIILRIDLNGKIIDSCSVSKFEALFYNDKGYFVRASKEGDNISLNKIRSDELFDIAEK